MKAQLLIIAACAFAASAQSQNVLGFSAGSNTTYTDRCGATNIEGDALNHYDTRDYQDWMLDPADPTGATMKFTRDLPGQAISLMPVPNVVCWLPTLAGVPTGPATYPAVAADKRQIWIELNANVASGVPVTQTNQTLYTSSNPGGTNTMVPLGGTTNMFSGLNPDLYDFNLQTPPRADDIGFLVNDVSVPNAPVFVLLSFGLSPVGSQPLVNLMSGSAGAGTKGNVCVDFTAAATFLGFSGPTGILQMMLPMSPATRAAYQALFPMNLVYQAFVLDTLAPGPGITIHATGCGVQHL
jgi:hypothetical protein